MNHALKIFLTASILFLTAIITSFAICEVDGDSISVNDGGYEYEINGNEATLVSLGNLESKVYDIPASITYDNKT